VAKYIGRRIVGLIPSVFLLLFIVVFMIELIPGDIIDLMLEEKSANSEENRAILQKELGLDKPLPVRYLTYIGNAVRGDFGESLWTKRPVTEMITGRLPATVEIGILSIVLGSIVGIIIGTVSAVKQDTPLDYALRSIATLGISVPNFAIATAVVVLPALWWGITPNLRYVRFTEAPWDHIKIILLPSVVLSIGLATSLMRISRTTMLEVMRQDYIRTARAKGIRESRVIISHAMKNAMIPVITLLGLQIAFLLSGSVITETVFAIPGVGRLLVASIASRDYPVVQGIVVMIALFVMATNLVIDISYAWIDPRIKFS
jgi:peptide/nickel transport system permease protein